MSQTYGPTRESRWDPIDWREHVAWQSSRSRPWVEGYLLAGEAYPGRDIALVDWLARIKSAHPYMVDYEACAL